MSRSRRLATSHELIIIFPQIDFPLLVAVIINILSLCIKKLVRGIAGPALDPGKACRHHQRAPTRTLVRLPVCAASSHPASTLLQSHHEQLFSRGLVCVCDELQSCCEHAASALIVHPKQRTSLRVRQVAVMLRACCECFDCASAGADVVPDATVRTLIDRNTDR